MNKGTEDAVIIILASLTNGICLLHVFWTPSLSDSLLFSDNQIALATRMVFCSCICCYSFAIMQISKDCLCGPG